MATSLLTPFSQYMFSSQLQVVRFSAELPFMSFKLRTASGDVLLSETYVISVGRVVAIYDLDKLIDSVMGEATAATFIFTADNVDLATVTVISSSVVMSTDALLFLNNSFLTPATYERDTVIGRYECLSVYAISVAAVTAVCRYMDQAGNVTSAVKSVRAADYARLSPVLLDVSPAKFTDSAKGDLIDYTVTCGSRTQRYRVLSGPQAVDPAVIFLNRFNVWDTFYFTGIKTTDPQYSRSQTYINGSFRTYSMDESMQYKAETGPMTRDMTTVAYELARSKRVHLLGSGGKTADEIVILDVEPKTTNDDYELQEMTFTYRLASRRTVKEFSESSVRIFDNSFDGSYE